MKLRIKLSELLYYLQGVGAGYQTIYLERTSLLLELAMKYGVDVEKLDKALREGRWTVRIAL
jgi:hypothetical protein